MSSLRAPLHRLYAPMRSAAKLISRRGLYPFLRREFAKLEPGDQVLSVGAGGEVNRILGEYATTIGFEVVSLDVSPDKQPDVVADICNWQSERPFDAIVIAEVLEHVQEPQKAIENLTASLSDGGRLILTVPFLLPIHDAPADFYRYTRHGLAWLLRGLQNVEIDERNSWTEAILALFARTSRSKSPGLRLLWVVSLPLVFLTYPLLWLVGHWLPFPELTTGYVVTAQRSAPESRTP